MRLVTDLREAAAAIIALHPDRLRIATPLGLGKPNPLLNEIDRAYRETPERLLEIYTALSLDFPPMTSSLERRFLEPFLARHYGANYPRLRYADDLRRGTLPPNIRVHEFYFMAGEYGRSVAAQSGAISVNYTHVARNLLERGLDVVIQLVAKAPNGQAPAYSLSCNPDVTLDLVDIARLQGKPLFTVGVVHPRLPYLGGDAAVNPEFFDLVVEVPEMDYELFSLPKTPVSDADHLIGLHASRLVLDDGTLQIGIGSLSEALVAALLARHRDNAAYLAAVEDLDRGRPPERELTLAHDVFAHGLYGASEMMMDGFMHLRRAGVLKRVVFDRDEGLRRYMHAAFYLGSKEFYDWLRSLSAEDFDGLAMTRVSKVNDLYDAHELALRRQRKNARFFNTCMQIGWLGGAVSDTLPDGQVVSGVGGQYNFVAMAHELSDARSVLMLRSARAHGGRRRTNIISETGELSIPRHLRDVVITEYGVASLRGKTDAEVIAALIEIAGSEFQDDLVATAKKRGKLPSSYRVPDRARGNTPERVRAFVERHRRAGFLEPEPFGNDFTPVEARLARALEGLKHASPLTLARIAMKGLRAPAFREELDRLGLGAPAGFAAHLESLVVRGALI